MCVKYLVAAGTLLSVNLLQCLPVDPPLPRKLAKPVLSFGGMAAVREPVKGYREAVRLSWTFTRTGNPPLSTFTLLRKLPADSFFDVFLGSRLLPADTTVFFDKLTGYTFPATGFDSVCYRICAVDTAGMTGDTSAPCVVVLAPQPVLTACDTSNGCLRWESWIRGGVSSWCSVWRGNGGTTWESQTRDDFPQTDEPCRFEACLPDSLRPPAPGTWYYALFIRANDTRSLKIGSIDVR